jgi:hypothetical protein
MFLSYVFDAKVIKTREKLIGHVSCVQREGVIGTGG